MGEGSRPLDNEVWIVGKFLMIIMVEEKLCSVKKLAAVSSGRELSFVQENTLMAFLSMKGELAPGHGLDELD